MKKAGQQLARAIGRRRRKAAEGARSVRAEGARSVRHLSSSSSSDPTLKERLLASRDAEEVLRMVVTDDPEMISTAFRSLAKLEDRRSLSSRLEGLAALAARSISERPEEWSPRDLALASSAAVNCGLATSPGFYETIARRAAESIEKFDGESISSIVTAYSKAKSDRMIAGGLSNAEDVLFAAIGRVLPSRSKTFTPQQCASTAAALTRSSIVLPGSYEALADRAILSIGDLEAPHLAMLSWAYENKPGRGVYDAIASVTPGKVNDFHAFALVNLVSNMSKAADMSKAAPAFEAIARALLPKLDQLGPKQLCATAGAFAKSRVAVPELYAGIAAAAEAKAGEFTPAMLSTLAFTYSKGLHAPDSMYHALAKAAMPGIDQLAPKVLASTADSFVKAGFAAPALFEAIARAGVNKARAMDPETLASLVNSFSTVKQQGNNLKKNSEAVQELFVEAIASSAMDQMSRFDPRNLSVLAGGYARTGIRAPLLFEAMVPRIIQIANKKTPQGDKAQGFTPFSIATIAWAFAKTQHPSPKKLFATLDRLATAQLSTFGPRLLSNMIWAFAKLVDVKYDVKKNHGALFDATAVVAIADIEKFNAQNFSNVAWAFAKAEIDAPLLFAEIAKAAPAKNMDDFNTQSLANMVWAFTKADAKTDPLFYQIISGAAMRQIKDFKKPQELSNICFGFSRVYPQVQVPALFKAMERTTLKNGVDRLSAQDLIKTAQAMTKVRYDAPGFFCRIAEAAVPKIEAGEFKASDIANFSWAYSRTKFARVIYEAVPEVFEAMASAAVPQITHFRTSALVSTAWAFAKTGNAASYPELFRAIASQSTRVVDEFNGTNLATLAWAFGEARIFDAPQLYSALAKAFISKLQTFKPETLVTTCLAFARSNTEAPEAYTALADLVTRAAAERYPGGRRPMPNAPRELMPLYFSPPMIANAAEAISKAGSLGLLENAPDLLGDIEKMALSKMDEFLSRSLAQIAAAYALTSCNKPLLDALIKKSRDEIYEFSPENLVLLAMSMEKLGVTDRDLWRDVSRVAKSEIDGFDATMLVEIAFLLSKFDAEYPALFEQIALKATLLLDANGFNNRQIAQLATAFARVREKEPLIVLPKDDDEYDEEFFADILMENPTLNPTPEAAGNEDELHKALARAALGKQFTQEERQMIQKASRHIPGLLTNLS